MTEMRDDVTIKVEDSNRDPEVKNAEEKEEETQEIQEKPVERMTKSELIQQVKALQDESQNHYDRYLRSQAEIENIKKRNAKEREDWVKYANESLIKEILPVMDNLQMAISHAHNENSLDALREGVELTLKGLKAALAKSGVEEIQAEGEPFDPSFHEAVSQSVDESAEAGVVLRELQKGYLLNRRLLRPSMVIVNKGKDPEASSQEDTPERAFEK